MSGYLKLAHDQFAVIAANTVRGLLNDQDLTDVTLVCGDGQHIKAHKVILSSFSPTFKKILLNIEHRSFVIYMKGVEHKQLKALIDFIYLGETKVDQNDFASFMVIAKDLRINGLVANSGTLQTEIKMVDNSGVEDKKQTALLGAEIFTHNSVKNVEEVAQLTDEYVTSPRILINQPLSYQNKNGASQLIF